MPRWDVTVTFEGPTSSTDNAAVRFCGTGGGTVQDSGLIIGDCGVVSGGSIATGFGNIDNGTSNITSGGVWSVDVDSGATINSCGGGLAAAGALTFGAGADAGFYVSSDDLYIENKTSDKDIIFRVNDGGTFKEVARVDGSVAAMKFSEITDPGDPGGGNGGYLYAKADGKPYWRSNEIAETALDAAGVGLGLVIALGG